MGKYIKENIKKKARSPYAMYDGKTPLLSVSTHSSRPTKVIEEKKSSKQEIVEDVMRQISRRMNYFGGGGSTRMDGFATALAASSGSSLVGTIAAGAGAVARTQQAKNRDIVSVFDYMTTAQIADVQNGTSSIDLRAVIATAVLAAKGGSLRFPNGRYLINTDGGSITLEYITILGDGVLDGSTLQGSSTGRGSVLSITGTTNQPFLVQRGVTFSGIGFFYPNQVDSATPTAYPPTLDFDFTDGAVQFVYVDRCVVFNAYRFCRINNAGGNVGHCWFTNNAIYGISTCFELTYNAEVLYFLNNDFTFGHWQAATESGCRAYTRANGIILQCNKSDGHKFDGNLCFGYQYGIKMSSGQIIQSRYSGNLFDNVLFPIYISSTGTFLHGTIYGNTFDAFNSQDTTKIGTVVSVLGTNVSAVNLSDNYFSSCTGNHVSVSGAAHEVIINGGKMENMGYSQASGTYAALNVNNGSAHCEMNNVSRVIGSSNAITHGVIAPLVATLCVRGNSFANCNNAVLVTGATNVILENNFSTGTVDTVSDKISGATVVWPAGNKWDKPSGTSTRPQFLATTVAATVFNGAAADCPFATVVFDLGSNFATPSFTAPQKGKYKLEVTLTHNAAAAVAGDAYTILIVTTARSYSRVYVVPVTGVPETVSLSALADMNSGDTAKVQVARSIGTNSFTLNADAQGDFFSGCLVE